MSNIADCLKYWSPAFDTMDDFVFLIDNDFYIRKVNRSFLEFSGKAESGIVGKKCHEIIHSTPHPPDECPHKRMITTQKFEASEFYDPSLKRWLYVRTTPVFDERGNLDGSIHLAADVTRRRQSEEAAAKLAAIVETSDDAILGKTLDGIITSWNIGAEKLYGYTAKEAIGRSINIIIPPDRVPELSRIYEKVGRGEHIEHFETIRIRKGGQAISVSLSISPIKDASGNIVGVSAIARDITASEEAKEELHKKIEELERFRKITIGREFKMKELKARITELEAKLTQP